MVNTERQIVREAEQAVRTLLDELGGFSIHSVTEDSGGPRQPCDLILDVRSSGVRFRIAVEVKMRITAETVLSVCRRMQGLPDDVLPVLYAPTISPRVAEIAGEHGIGYIDGAGNCRLQSAHHHFLIDRRGRQLPRRMPRGVANPFSPKSSRIVRAMLSRPAEGWKVRELAKHPDVDVAVGLVSKVKRTLIEEGYAVEHEKLLYLRDPVGLLENWAKKYPGPAEQIPLYFRGDVEAAEDAVARWGKENGVRYAMAGFSAAWRLTPEVRYAVGAVYVESRGFDRDVFDTLRSFTGGKRVDTGANLLLWRPFDRSVFADSEPSERTDEPRTSALQTFLDLKRLAGRGEEAATAVYDQYLAHPLQAATQRGKELRDDQL